MTYYPRTNLLVVYAVVRRGRFQRGRIVEAGAGKAITGVDHENDNAAPQDPKATEWTISCSQDRTDGNGRFQIVVTPGPGRLEVTPTKEYVYRVIGWSKTEYGIPVTNPSDADSPVKIVPRQGTESK